MKNVDVLVVVDTVGALASGDLQSNVYLVDTNKYIGSWNEGNCELETVCRDTQMLKWRVVSIDPDSDVEIAGFTGDMINQEICSPTKVGIGQDIYWEGTVETRGHSGRYQYSVTISIDGRQLSFDPFIDVK